MLLVGIMCLPNSAQIAFFTYSYFVKLIKQIKYNMCTYDKKVLNICAYTGWNTLQVSYHNLFDKQY